MLFLFPTILCMLWNQNVSIPSTERELWETVKLLNKQQQFWIRALSLPQKCAFVGIEAFLCNSFLWRDTLCVSKAENGGLGREGRRGLSREKSSRKPQKNPGNVTVFLVVVSCCFFFLFFFKSKKERVLCLNAGFNSFGYVCSKAASLTACLFLFMETGFVFSL